RPARDRRRARRRPRGDGVRAPLRPLPARGPVPAVRGRPRRARLMFGLDDKIAGLGDGSAFVLLALVAMLLGLRHATDPDHLTAVSTLAAGEEPDPRGAARLGLAWGLGHATSLFAFGVP